MISDATIQSAITAVVTLGLAWIAARKLNAIAKTGEQTHRLVNSASILQLKLYVIATRRIANLTHDGADMKIATEAQNLLTEREAEQAAIDAKEGKTT